MGRIIGYLLVHLGHQGAKPNQDHHESRHRQQQLSYSRPAPSGEQRPQAWCCQLIHQSSIPRFGPRDRAADWR